MSNKYSISYDPTATVEAKPHQKQDDDKEIAT